MSSLRVIHLTSIEQLRAAAAAWDDLWWRCDVAMPTTRAELVAQWLERFHPTAKFRVVAVESDGRWIAALPLVGSRVGWVIPAAGLPSNSWSPCGDVLLDPAADVNAAADRLLASASCLPWQLLWLNEAVPDAWRWRSLLRACHRAGIPAVQHERYRVGRVEIHQTWDAYQKQLPKNHRQAMNRALRRLRGEGDVRLERLAHLDVQEIEPRLRAAFEVEDRGWKGRAGSSVLATRGMFEYFVRQAKQLAKWDQLELVSLRLNERAIAVLYGFRAKDVLFAHKIGYDPAMAAFVPGQLLFYLLLEQLHEGGEIHALDFMGPLNQSLSRWRPATYTVGRIAVAVRRPLGRAAVYAYENWWPRIRNAQAACAPESTEPSVDPPVGEPAGA